MRYEWPEEQGGCEKIRMSVVLIVRHGQTRGCEANLGAAVLIAGAERCEQ